MQCWRTVLSCTCHDAKHWSHSVLQPQSQSSYSSWTLQDRDCHTTALALQTDRWVPVQSVSFTTLWEKSLLLSKISWNTFYIIVASLDKRAQLDLSFCRCPLCGNYLPVLKIAMAVRSRLFPNLLWGWGDQLLCEPYRLSDQGTSFPEHSMSLSQRHHKTTPSK